MGIAFLNLIACNSDDTRRGQGCTETLCCSCGSIRWEIGIDTVRVLYLHSRVGYLHCSK
jgi:hypothetical protein